MNFKYRLHKDPGGIYYERWLVIYFWGHSLNLEWKPSKLGKEQEFYRLAKFLFYFKGKNKSFKSCFHLKPLAYNGDRRQTTNKSKTPQ